MVIFLWLGWPVEARLNFKQFLSFIGITAYLPTYLQVVYSVTTNGTAASLGFSGSVYALPPLLFCLILYEDHSVEIGFGDLGNIALIWTVAIPFVILGFSDFFSVLPSAKITHAGGYISGIGYGIHKIKTNSKQ